MKQKNPIIEVYNVRFERIPVKTRILTKDDAMAEVVKEYALPLMRAGDILSISESPLAITQGRAVPVAELKIGFLAKVLWRFVAKVPYGIGLRAPSSMQCAIDECGAGRILFAAAVGALGKLLGKKGWFYKAAGKQAALIDACGTSPVPPYNETVIKGPLHPEKEAQRISDRIGYPVAIMDINDIGGSWMIGASKGVSKHFMEMVMKDNPQGQADELTPMCIVRRVS
ncbi:MAG TPA: hypothetical protein PKJ14_02040 [Candidatus Cloacimonadota bacterium]|nr:hypothetical protein [Candidatus Cloacimonadota bacterium]HQL14359.1 hypothetical protein [Candidatus Cloacimonadota bacterium]